MANQTKVIFRQIGPHLLAWTFSLPASQLASNGTAKEKYLIYDHFRFRWFICSNIFHWFLPAFLLSLSSTIVQQQLPVGFNYPQQGGEGKLRGSVTPQPIQQVLECVVVVLQQGVHVVLAKLSTGTNEKEVSQVQEGARVPGGLPIREDDTGGGVVLRIETENTRNGGWNWLFACYFCWCGAVWNWEMVAFYDERHFTEMVVSPRNRLDDNSIMGVCSQCAVFEFFNICTAVVAFLLQMFF